MSNSAEFNVLIVDDNINNLFTLEALLQDNFDVNVVHVQSGREALTAISKNDIDLMLCDVKMPDMDGFEVARLIKSRPSTAQLPIIFITAHDPSQQLVEQSLEAGGVDYITKPIDDFKLVNRLNVYFSFIRREREMTNQLKLKANELDEHQEYLKLIVDSIDAALVTVDNSGLITQWNKVLLDMLSFEWLEKDFTGLYFADVAPCLTAIEEDVKTILTGDKRSLTPKRMVLDVNGFDRYFDISVYPLSSDFKLGAVIKLLDVTEIEEREQQLRQAQKMEMIGNLAGGLAHDFNNVLGGIKGALSMVRYFCQNKEYEEIPEFTRIATQSAERAADMVKQLLTLSRRNNLSFSLVDLRQSLMNVAGICKTSFPKSVTLDIQDLNCATFVNADPTQIEQALLNLCVNASHAMTMMRHADEPQGGEISITTTLFTADKYFCESHANLSEGDYYLVSISDSGIGIPKDNIENIFDPFFTTKDKGSGSGLGLSMVYNIVKLHGGLIDVNSEVGVGTTFSVFLPIPEQAIVNLDKQEIYDQVYKGTGVILVIDDEDIIRMTAGSILKHCGYDVVFACDGLEGVEMYKELQGDIAAVLLDMAMPKLSGDQVYEKIKAINPDEKILLTSGFKQDQRVQKILQRDSCEFIQKPYSLYELSRKVYSVLYPA